MIVLEGGGVILTRTFIRGCSAWQGGGLVVHTGATVEVHSSHLLHNRAREGGGGAAVVMWKAHLKLVRCQVSHNVAGPGMAAWGGGVWTAGHLATQLSNFTSNTATGEGGGLAVNGAATSAAAAAAATGTAADAAVDIAVAFVDLVDSTFFGNQAARGGAVALCCGVSAVLHNCTLESNHALDGGGGGLLLTSFSSAMAVGCTVLDNTATREGGGILITSSSLSSSSFSSPSSLTMEFSSVRGNAASLSGGGAAVAPGAALVLLHCELTSNFALLGDGGGILLQGAAGGGAGAAVTLNASTLRGNIASGHHEGEGGGKGRGGGGASHAWIRSGGVCHPGCFQQRQ